MQKMAPPPHAARIRMRSKEGPCTSTERGTYQHAGGTCCHFVAQASRLRLGFGSFWSMEDRQKPSQAPVCA